MISRILIVAAALSFAPGYAHASPTCIQNFLFCESEPNNYYTTDYHYSIQCPEQFRQTGPSDASYDLISGILSTTDKGTNYGTSSGLYVGDIYDVTGLLNCPANLTLLVHMVGRFTTSQRGASGGFTLSVQDSLGNGPSLSLEPTVSTTTDTVLTVSFPACPRHFQIYYYLQSNAYLGDYSATVTFSFANLPPGASIVSCQGYRQEPPVSALPSTWGRVRARYR